ncbi:MAG: YceI family protein [Ginsengibacter sp.]
MPGLIIISWWISLLSLFGANNEIKSIPITFSFEKGSKVSIDGTTNVKDFICNSKKLFAHQNAELKQEDSGKTSFNNAALDFNISSLNCGNNGMNRDMMKAMKADKYPVISVKLTDAQMDRGKTLSLSGWTTIKLNVSISMAGSTKNAFIIVQGKQTGKSLYRFVGQYSMLMTDFGITPPTALFGMVKVMDAIIVKFDLIVATQ